ncbi:MAG: hypothetical protein ACREME_03125, partial [Gemmatimonadales bacterium]
DLELDNAAGLLRRALAVEGAGALVPADASRALIYLAATELLRAHGDSARAVARRLALADPRFRPDGFVFPPQVLSLYEQVRRTTPAVIAAAPADTAIRPGRDALAVRLYASTFHDVVATLVAADGHVVRTLYRGPIEDSLLLHWNGLDSAGTEPPPHGHYAITVSSLDRAQRVVRILRLPLEILEGSVDTLPYPPPPADSVLLPERRPVGPALRALAPGLLAGAAIAVLPGLVTDGEDASGARFVVGGTVTLVGIAAFLSHRPGRSIPANVAHNRVIRDWRRAVADVTRRNAERARERIGVRMGAPTILTPTGGRGSP